MVEQISDVRGGMVVGGFISKDKEVVLCLCWYWELVLVLEDRGDVGVSEQEISRVLDVLQFMIMSVLSLFTFSKFACIHDWSEGSDLQNGDGFGGDVQLDAVSVAAESDTLSAVDVSKGKQI